MVKKKITIDTAAPQNPDASLLIIYTGGTVGMVYDSKGALVPFNFQQILDKIPSINKFNLLLTVVSFEQLIDSASATPDTWVEIGDIIFKYYNNYDGFVVLHGTDTMAYSASALSYMLEGLAKPVVFTGAQLPIGAVRTDARENLLASLEIASAKNSDGSPKVPEVCIYFNSRLLRGNRARKVQSVYFDAFESTNFPLLAEAGVEIHYNQRVIRSLNKGDNLQYFRKFDENVFVLKLYPGISRQLVETIFYLPGLRGVILETFGSGNAPNFPWLREILKKSVDSGILILNVSQCHGGKVIPGRYLSGRWLQEIGVLNGADITSEAALTKLMFLLGKESSEDERRSRLIEPISGEMTKN